MPPDLSTKIFMTIASKAPQRRLDGYASKWIQMKPSRDDPADPLGVHVLPLPLPALAERRAVTASGATALATKVAEAQRCATGRGQSEYFAG